jgi:hypothetical protein
MNNDNTIADKVLQQINYRLQYSRDRKEREVLKSVLLAVGITSLRNSKDNTLAIRQDQT